MLLGPPHAGLTATPPTRLVILLRVTGFARRPQIGWIVCAALGYRHNVVNLCRSACASVAADPAHAPIPVEDEASNPVRQSLPWFPGVPPVSHCWSSPQSHEHPAHAAHELPGPA